MIPTQIFLDFLHARECCCSHLTNLQHYYCWVLGGGGSIVQFPSLYLCTTGEKAKRRFGWKLGSGDSSIAEFQSVTCNVGERSRRGIWLEAGSRRGGCLGHGKLQAQAQPGKPGGELLNC